MGRGTSEEDDEFCLNVPDKMLLLQITAQELLSATDIPTVSDR